MSAERNAECRAALARWIAPALPWLPTPAPVERPIPYLSFEFDAATWSPLIKYPPGIGRQADHVWVHEAGHWLQYFAGQWYPGGGTAAVREFLTWHRARAALAEDIGRLGELWAEHFTRAFFPGYAGSLYPALVGVLPFRSVEDSRGFFLSLASEAYCMARWISGDLAVATDAVGNGRAQVPVSGLKPGVPAVGFAQRIGIAGTEATLPNASFATDTDEQLFGVLNFRGDSVKNGTTYWRLAAFQ